MIDIKKELYHARLLQELKSNEESMKELGEAYNNIDDLIAKNIIKSLIISKNSKILEVETLLEICMRSVLK